MDNFTNKIDNKILKNNETEYIIEQIKNINKTLNQIIDYACSCSYATGYCECMGENVEYKRGLNTGFELAKIINNMGKEEKLKYFNNENININNLIGEEVEQILYKEKRYI